MQSFLLNAHYRSLGDGMDGLGQVINVLGRYSGHRDAAVLGQVHAKLLGQSLALLLIHSGEAEHADLFGDVLPVARRAQLFQIVLQFGAHRDDSIGHQFDIAEPFLFQVCITQDFRNQAGAMNRRVAVHRTNQDLDLRHGASGFLLVGADQRKGSGSFTVKTHVLGETLSQRNLVTILQEGTDGKRILGDISAGKALVGHVEEGEQVAFLEDGGHFSPLLRPGINTGWVVSAGVQKDDGSLWDFL